MRGPRPDPRLAGTPWAGVTAEQFHRHSWQLKNRVESLDALSSILDLTESERAGFEPASRLFRFAITPYYALLADREDPSCPVRRQIVPRLEETDADAGALTDPMGEQAREAAPNLIHRYPDRALLLVTDRCSVYCRFCTRRRVVGRTEQQTTRALLEQALAYVRRTPAIGEVILSGGDALLLSDARLDWLLGEIRAIEHVDIVRVATRMPVTCPMRITDRLVEVLARHPPLYVMTHFNHEKECTESAWSACGRLADAGVMIYNQSVLLRGINDDVETMRKLVKGLLRMRVRPYYIYQAQTLTGTAHFITPIEKGLEIMAGLRGFTSGLGVPVYLLDTPYGKIPMHPQTIVDRDDEAVYLKAWNGKVWREPNKKSADLGAAASAAASAAMPGEGR